MTARPSQPPLDSRPTPGIDTTWDSTRAGGAAETEFWALCEVSATLLTASDAIQAAEETCACLAQDEAFGFRRALLFLVDEERGWLQGVAAGVSATAPAADGEAPLPAGEERRQAGLVERVRAIRVPLGEAGEHPLTGLLQAASRQGAATRGTAATLSPEATGFGGEVEACLGKGPCRVLSLAGRHRPQGLLILEEAPEGEPVDPGRLLRAGLLARQTALAIETLRAAEAARAQGRGFTRLVETIRTVLGAGSLPDVLTMIARGALRATHASCVVLWTYNTAHQKLLPAVHLPRRRGDSLEEWLPALEQLAQNGRRHRGARTYPDLRAEAGLGLENLPQPLAALAVPLEAFGDYLGALVVVRGGEEGAGPAPFGEPAEGRLAVLTGLAAVAVRNAQLAEETRAASQQLRGLRGELGDAEQLAAWGAQLRDLARDLEAVWGGVDELAEHIESDLPSDEPAVEYARAIRREMEQVRDRLAEMPVCCLPGPPRLVMRDLNEVLQNLVGGLREQIVERGVVMEEAYAEEVPRLLLDVARIEHALGNLLRHTLAAARPGETIRIETLRQGERVLLEIACSGASPEGELLEALFTPFAMEGVGAGGVSLAVAQQIVQEHGGEISVRSEEEWRAVYTLSFPVRWNQERRRRRDRRSGGDRRRRKRSA